MAFTFSGAALRFNEKRMLVAEEVNTFETAYLRLDLPPRRHTPRALQDRFRPGLIHLENADQLLVDLRASMK